MFDQKVDWFYLAEGEYVSLPIDADGVIRRRMFPGLWLAANNLPVENMVQVLAVLQQGLASLEYTAFVHQLSKLD